LTISSGLKGEDNNLDFKLTLVSFIYSVRFAAIEISGKKFESVLVHFDLPTIILSTRNIKINFNLCSLKST